MIFYIIIWCILLVFSFRSYNKYIYWGSLFFLSIIAGFRDVNIGADTHNYALMFSMIPVQSLHWASTEVGWQVLNRIVFYSGMDFHLFCWVVALLTLGLLGIVAKKVSINPQLSIFFYYSMYAYLNSFNIMRQLLAISIVIVAYMYLMKEKRFYFILMILLASTVHASALVVLPVYFVRKFEVNAEMVVYILLLTFILGGILTDSVFSFFSGGYSSYSSTYRDNLASAAIMTAMLNIIFFYLYKSAGEHIRGSLAMTVFFIAIIVNNLTFRLLLGARIILYFTIIQIFLFPLFFKNEVKADRTIIRLIIIIYIGIVFFKILVLGNEGIYSLYPYKTVFLNYI